jgi:hypothetical protein
MLTCEEIGILIDPSSCFSNTKNAFEFTDKFASVWIGSCIFFNFWDQCRAGIDSEVLIEKCHLSEPRNNNIVAINPRVLKIIGCNFSKPSRHCVLVEWLPTSFQTEKCRNLYVEGCELYNSGSSSILIAPKKDLPADNQLNSCAHNLKIQIINNKFLKSRSEGMCILNLIVTSLEIINNEFNQNWQHNLYIK